MVPIGQCIIHRPRYIYINIGHYINLFVEFVAMLVPIVTPKDNNYSTSIQSIYVKLDNSVDCSMMLSYWYVGTDDLVDG